MWLLEASPLADFSAFLMRVVPNSSVFLLPIEDNGRSQFLAVTTFGCTCNLE